MRQHLQQNKVPWAFCGESKPLVPNWSPEKGLSKKWWWQSGILLGPELWTFKVETNFCPFPPLKKSYKPIITGPNCHRDNIIVSICRFLGSIILLKHFLLFYVAYWLRYNSSCDEHSPCIHVNKQAKYAFCTKSYLLHTITHNELPNPYSHSLCP